MTDAYNTSENKDPQMANLQREITIGTVGTVSKQNNSKEKGYSDNYAELYNKGIKHFTKHNLLVELNKNGEHCGHDIWIRSEPTPIKGINYPKDFNPFRPLFTNEDFSALNAIYKMLDSDTKEFWEPLVYPKNRDNPLSQYADRLNAMKKVQNRYSIAEIFEDKHTHSPSEKGVFGKKSLNPKTWVPAIEWFDDNIKQLTFDDIFILLPKAEREIFKLWLGRIGCGRSNHIPDNSDNPIVHTARMAVILLSKQAGLTY